MGSLTISGRECVDALRLAGFRVVRRSCEATLLRRDQRLVVVPNALELPASVLDSLLEESNLSHERFLWLLSEAATEPDLTRVGAST